MSLSHVCNSALAQLTWHLVSPRNLSAWFLTHIRIDSLFPATTSTIPTVTDNLFANGLITANEIGVSFEPTTQQSVVNGELTWGTFFLFCFFFFMWWWKCYPGGTDSTKFTGSISFTPITTTSPASGLWGINQSIRYGTSATILSSTAGIVDTGEFWVLSPKKKKFLFT